MGAISIGPIGGRPRSVFTVKLLPMNAYPSPRLGLHFAILPPFNSVVANIGIRKIELHTHDASKTSGLQGVRECGCHSRPYTCRKVLEHKFKHTNMRC